MGKSTKQEAGAARLRQENVRLLASLRQWLTKENARLVPSVTFVEGQFMPAFSIEVVTARADLLQGAAAPQEPPNKG